MRRATGATRQSLRMVRARTTTRMQRPVRFGEAIVKPCRGAYPADQSGVPLPFGAGALPLSAPLPALGLPSSIDFSLSRNFLIMRST